MQITADRVEVSADGATITYSGHVKVRQGDRVSTTERLVVRRTDEQLRLSATARDARIKAAEVDTHAAQQMFDDAKQRFQVGLATAKEVSLAERDLFAARARLESERAGDDAGGGRARTSPTRGSTGVRSADAKRSALNAGDWHAAAAQGATASEVVRTLQAKGLYRELNPDQAVVTIGPDNEVEAMALKPLPAIDGALIDTRTAPLAGTGFEFSRKPGSIVLYPAYTGRSMRQSGR